MVSVLISDQAVRVRVLARDIVYTHVYKWVPANLMLRGIVSRMLGENLRWTYIPSKGSEITPSHLINVTDTGDLG